MKIGIEFIKNKNTGGHSNIIVRIPEINLFEVCDSYYYAIDRSFMPDDESTNKVILSLIENLRYWIKSIDELVQNKTQFFPFDLSDQYVGFIAVDLIAKNLLSVKYGITQEFGGYSINAYMPQEFKVNKPISNSKEFIISREDFKYEIQLSISHLENQIDSIN